VAGEEQHLLPLCGQLEQQGDGRRRPIFVEVDDHIVENQREGSPFPGQFPHYCQSYGQEQLFAGPAAQGLHGKAAPPIVLDDETALAQRGPYIAVLVARHLGKKPCRFGERLGLMRALEIATKVVDRLRGRFAHGPITGQGA